MPSPQTFHTTSPLDTVVRILRAQTLLARRFDRELGSVHGVSFNDFLILTHIGAAPGGRIRRIDLAEQLSVTASGITRALGPLERIGTITRETDPRDARVSYASLTDAGQRLLADIRNSAEAIGSTVLTPLMSDDDQATLTDLLARLGATGLPA